MKTYVEKVTPELAERYLSYNVHNRNIRPRKVAQYAEEMRSGQWRNDKDAVAFFTVTSATPSRKLGRARIAAAPAYIR